jgi:hypothetical protein
MASLTTTIVATASLIMATTPSAAAQQPEQIHLFYPGTVELVSPVRSAGMLMCGNVL